MSSSQWVASINAPGSPTVYFSFVEIDSAPGLESKYVNEPLIAQGADGRRWRKVHRQSPLLRFRAMEPLAIDVEDQMSIYNGIVGKVADVRVRLTNFTQTWAKAYVVDWRKEGRVLGPLVGYGSVASSTQTLQSSWIIDTSQGGV